MEVNTQNESTDFIKARKMATITIRNLDDEVKRRLRIRAAEHNCSMEEEVRSILRAAVSVSAPATNLADAIRARFESLGGVEIQVPPRELMRDPPPPKGRRASWL